MLSIFLSYFVLFTFVLYPNLEVLRPDASADYLQTVLPDSFKWPLAMYRHWVFTSFYVMSELWSNIVLTVLIWGFANQVTKVSESKRFYGLFGLGANLSGIFAGLISAQLSQIAYNPAIPYGKTSWDQSLLMLISLVIVVGIAAIVLFRWVDAKVLSDPLYYDPEEVSKENRIKGNLSFRESLKYVFSSPYMASIAVIVLAYNIAMNLVEVIWKDEIKALLPESGEFSVYINYVSAIIGLIATINALFVSGNSIRKFGWTFTALLTPAIILLTSIGFFSFFFMKEYGFTGGTLLMGMDPLVLVVFFGSAQNILSRAAKYSVYDATKEMAFVPLTPESKIKGKAAIDGVGSRLGKTGGSLIHQGLLINFKTFSESAPYVAGILASIIFLWVFVTRYVGRCFNAMAASPVRVPIEHSPVLEVERPFVEPIGKVV
jgi:AAA family ATP:ADP antiporter